MEDAFASHAVFTRDSASWSEPIFCTNIPSKRRHCSIRALSPILISLVRGRRAALHLESSRGRGRACFLPDVSIGMHRGRWSCDRRSDSPSCFSSQSAQSDIRPGWGRCRGNLNPDEHISERVIFPITESQSNGIEDARFVEFDEGGRRTFYATYTAYSGKAIRSEFIETTTLYHSVCRP